MSTAPAQDVAAPPPGPSTAQRGAWSLTWHGVRTVAVLELRQRIRTTKWIVGLVAWFGIIGIVTALAAISSTDWDDNTSGRLVFDIVTFFVLFLGLLVAPTLSSSAINGDRNAGTLAILQVTLLTPGEIAVGKLLAGWAASLAFLAASLPFIVFAWFLGGVPVLAVLATVGLLALVLAVVVGVGLGFSALVPKTSSSAVLTYLTVATLAAITPVLFGLSLIPTTQSTEVRVYQWPAAVQNTWDWESGDPPTSLCEWTTEEWSMTQTQHTWWLLAANPFVVVADALPEERVQDDGNYYPEGIMSAIRYGVREARMGPQLEHDYCWSGQPGYVSPVEQREIDASPVWPWGLVANLLLGVAGLTVTVRRLSIPVGKLPRGTRIA